ncbi:putative Mitochondrial transcription termination factor family protein [Hibiscus syriacus]|uniref:Mitochondrial transcription termination factor family protein n=1 Tax=Hibiscus syriacus TaxID=106335 RepID=A0A6A3AHM8_HIBSY|nr:putative Mitochondrial transcription termination factor family protein [Hibiscus syriacus]
MLTEIVGSGGGFYSHHRCDPRTGPKSESRWVFWSLHLGRGSGGGGESSSGGRVALGEAIKTSIQRNGGMPFESKRTSPGGPDPQHHYFAESKRALVEEGREAIKASIQRNGGMLFESKRTSPGGPDPQHH